MQNEKRGEARTGTKKRRSMYTRAARYCTILSTWAELSEKKNRRTQDGGKLSGLKVTRGK